MWIMNQEKNCLVNLTNIDCIKIDDPLDNNEGEFEIRVENEWMVERLRMLQN